MCPPDLLTTAIMKSNGRKPKRKNIEKCNLKSQQPSLTSILKTSKKRSVYDTLGKRTAHYNSSCDKVVSFSKCCEKKVFDIPPENSLKIKFYLNRWRRYPECEPTKMSLIPLPGGIPKEYYQNIELRLKNLKAAMAKNMALNYIAQYKAELGSSVQLNCMHREDMLEYIQHENYVALQRRLTRIIRSFKKMTSLPTRGDNDMDSNSSGSDKGAPTSTRSKRSMVAGTLRRSFGKTVARQTETMGSKTRSSGRVNKLARTVIANKPSMADKGIKEIPEVRSKKARRDD